MQRLHHAGGDLEAHGRVDIMDDMSRHDARAAASADRQSCALYRLGRAREILEHWDAYLPKFRKVMPVEYRRALAELAAQRGGEMLLAAGE